MCSYYYRLVNDLGLRSTLTEYNVPPDHAPQIAEKAMGGRSDKAYPDVVKLLQDLYA